MTYLDSERSDRSNDIKRATQDAVILSFGIILPDGSGICDGGYLGDVGHNIHVPKVGDMPEATRTRLKTLRNNI